MINVSIATGLKETEHAEIKSAQGWHRCCGHSEFLPRKNNQVKLQMAVRYSGHPCLHQQIQEPIQKTESDIDHTYMWFWSEFLTGG